MSLQLQHERKTGKRKQEGEPSLEQRLKLALHTIHEQEKLICKLKEQMMALHEQNQVLSHIVKSNHLYLVPK
jgi:hypothetical protein